jgi:hypothetical protein
MVVGNGMTIEPRCQLGVQMSEEDNNEPAETRAALLIATDPRGRAKVIFHNVTELSQEEFDRYSEAYQTQWRSWASNLLNRCRWAWWLQFPAARRARAHRRRSAVTLTRRSPPPRANRFDAG